MLTEIKEKFNIDQYKSTIGKKTNIHKVSYFFKKDIKDLHTKKILFLDFEFSMNKFIFEVGGFILNKGVLEETIFEEYSLPANEPVWSFEQNKFVIQKTNTKKQLFSKLDAIGLKSIISRVDYVVAHNYVAEAQCLFKIDYPNEKYDVNKVEIFNSDKIICTNYSFNNGYFKKFGITECSNSKISETMGWNITDIGDSYLIKNELLSVSFKMKKPIGVESKLHNSFYDSIITLTNFFSLKKIAEWNLIFNSFYVNKHRGYYAYLIFNRITKNKIHISTSKTKSNWRCNWRKKREKLLEEIEKISSSIGGEAGYLTYGGNEEIQNIPDLFHILYEVRVANTADSRYGKGHIYRALLIKKGGKKSLSLEIKEGEKGLAIGKGGSNIKRAQEILGIRISLK